MMRERQLREGATPEEEAEEAPYTADWEGIPQGYVLGPLLFDPLLNFVLLLPKAIQTRPTPNTKSPPADADILVLYWKNQTKSYSQLRNLLREWKKKRK